MGKINWFHLPNLARPSWGHFDVLCLKTFGPDANKQSGWFFVQRRFGRPPIRFWRWANETLSPSINVCLFSLIGSQFSNCKDLFFFRFGTIKQRYLFQPFTAWPPHPRPQQGRFGLTTASFPLHRPFYYPCACRSNELLCFSRSVWLRIWFRSSTKTNVGIERPSIRLTNVRKSVLKCALWIL